MALLQSQADSNTRIIVIITCIVFIIACVLAYLIYHSIARPIRYLTLAAEEIGSGNLDKRIHIGTDDELEQLGKSFNDMAENLNKSMVSRGYVDNIIQSMGDMLVVTNSDFEIELINKSISETLGYNMGSLRGKKIWSLISDSDVPLLKEILLKTEAKKSFEVQYKTSTGTDIPVIISFSYLRESDGTSRGVVFVASNITVQKEAEMKVSRSLREKEVLLAEIHHRVKNNLAVISGLLEMQVWNLPDDDKSIGPLKESQLRIHSIALVHELLYQSDTLSEIKLDEYIEKLLRAIQKTHASSEKAISVTTNLAQVRLTIQKAIPASLLLNELVVNSYKHAFRNLSKGKIEIILKQENGRIELTVLDDGVGLPSDFDPFRQKTLGMTLVKTLVQQINARLHVGTGGERIKRKGSRFMIEFEEDQRVQSDVVEKSLLYRSREPEELIERRIPDK
ncbi:MAG: histidine kinase dimerization/phosphoacceptor domain -containing protein [Balneolaceae bacterium]